MERARAEQRVLDRFFEGDRLVLMPTRRAKRLVVLDEVAQRFELGRTYPEQEVNALLAPIHPDVPALRRHLVDEQFLSREAGVYWRSGGTVDLDALGPGGNARRGHGYSAVMSDDETPPLEDADRTITDVEDDVDPEAPSDSTTVNPPRDDADRPVPGLEDDPDDVFQEENAASSLDQPSDQIS